MGCVLENTLLIFLKWFFNLLTLKNKRMLSLKCPLMPGPQDDNTSLTFLFTIHHTLTFYIQKISKAILFKMPYCYRKQHVSCLCPSRLQVYLAKLISEGQWLAHLLYKHSQAKQNKEHKRVTQKCTALLKNCNAHFCSERRVLLINKGSTGQ